MIQRFVRYIIFDLALIIVSVIFIAIITGHRCSYGEAEITITVTIFAISLLALHVLFAKIHLNTNYLNSFVYGLVLLIITFFTLFLVIISTDFLPDNISNYIMLFILGVFVLNNFLWDRLYLYIRRRNQLNQE